MLKYGLWFLLIAVAKVVGHKINTSAGQVRGIVKDAFTMYLGIPYGMVNETNPFASATPPPPSATQNDSTVNPPICPQHFNRTTKGDIHCLYLNVYTPNEIKTDSTLPVMVYIHGGAFKEGDGTYDTYPPDFLVPHNIIFVSINYRLGIYGFLCTDKPEYNNQGLKDQVLALKWIKSNLNSFGGDPNNMVLVGHSAGAVSTNFLLLFNDERYFSKAIMQSGFAVTPTMAITPFESDLRTSLAKKLNFTGNPNDTESIITFLSAMNVHKLIDLTKNETFRPCLDDGFIKLKPNANNIGNMKIIVGSTNRDTLAVFDPKTVDSRAILTQDFRNVTDKMAEYVKKFYLTNNRYDVIDYTTDYWCNYPIERSARYYLENGAEVYRYLFSYDGGRNLMKLDRNMQEAGAVHADELGYLFKVARLENMSEADAAVVDGMTTMWTNFAKFGDPTPDGYPVTWAPQTEGAKPYLHVDSTFDLRHDAYPQRMAFWDMFYHLYRVYVKSLDYGESKTICTGNM